MIALGFQTCTAWDEILLAPPHGYLSHPLPHRSPAHASARENLMHSQVNSCLLEFLLVCSAWPANFPPVSWAQFPGALPKSWQHMGWILQLQARIYTWNRAAVPSGRALGAVWPW